MGKTGATFKIFQRYSMMVVIGLWGLGGMSSLGAAQPTAATATVSSLREEVFISFQGGTPIAGIAGTILRAGDAVRTYLGAATLNLSDGSKLELGENTQLVLTALPENVQTSSPVARLNLFWGRCRAILSPVYQKAGSAFTVQTPNTLAGVKASEADLEVSYEPTTKTTFVLAHEFDARVIHLGTGVALVIPKGHSAIIAKEVIQEVARILDLAAPPAAQQQTATLRTVNGKVLVSIQGGMLIPGLESTVLRSGDAIQTESGANAALELTDGAALQLGESTHLAFVELTANTPAGGGSVRLELQGGKLRLVAKDASQTGAVCTVQTPNVAAALNLSAADIEVQYQPHSLTTTVIAHKSEVLMTHLQTATALNIPEGHSGIVQRQIMQEIARILGAPPETGQPPAESSPSASKGLKETPTPKAAKSTQP